MRAAFADVPHTICYSVKANSNLTILRVFARLGSSFDIVSGGELERLNCAGVPGRRIVFSGVGKTRDEIREALRARILLFNVESEAELELLLSEASRLGRPAPAALRINPDIEAGGHPHISTGRHHHKFGMEWGVARELYLAARSKRWISWRGISAHIGSQILSLAPFRRSAQRMARHVRDLARHGIKLRYFDFGGGLGVRYNAEQPPDWNAYGRAIARVVKPLGCRLLLEPGRSLVGPAGILLTRVIYMKTTNGKNFIVVDAAMNDLLRPALYGATHPVTPAARPQTPRENIRADIVGPICESGDSFVQDWPIAKPESGDLFVIWGTGAYGFVLASNYNSRPRPAEVIVEGHRFRIIRRRESRADLVRGE
jgi:diaminopimelate decarboxylase